MKFSYFNEGESLFESNYYNLQLYLNFEKLFVDKLVARSITVTLPSSALFFQKFPDHRRRLVALMCGQLSIRGI